MTARRAVRTARAGGDERAEAEARAAVDQAKRGLGERGAVWWTGADRVNMIWWDGTGLWLLAKTLEQGAFSWPKARDGAMRLTPAQLSALPGGLDWLPGLEGEG